MEREKFIELWKALCAGKTITDVIVDESFSLSEVPKASLYLSDRTMYTFEIKPKKETK